MLLCIFDHFQNIVISQFINKDAVNSMKSLKKELEKYFLPIPTVLSYMEKVLKDTSASIEISSGFLKGSGFNIKKMTDDVSKYDGIRYVFTVLCYYPK